MVASGGFKRGRDCIKFSFRKMSLVFVVVVFFNVPWNRFNNLAP